VEVVISGFWVRFGLTRWFLILVSSKSIWTSLLNFVNESERGMVRSSVSQFIEISKLEIGLEGRIVDPESEEVGEIGVTFGASMCMISGSRKFVVTGEFGGGWVDWLVIREIEYVGMFPSDLEILI
jgi:hypothetical protein